MFGEHDIQIGETKGWHAGPIDVFACRQRGELKVGRRQTRAANAIEINALLDMSEGHHDSSFSTTRFSTMENTSQVIHISPRTAPSPVVISLREPVVLRPDSVTQVFVSTPVWIAFRTVPTAKPFHEIPSLDLKQTWFGANHREGELCLSSMSQGTIHADFVTHHPLRALTRLDVHQSGTRPFRLEKLKLPMPALNLYRDDEDHLHTDGLQVTLQNERVELRLTKALRIAGSKSATLVCKARSKGTTGLERALSAMLS